MGRTRLGLLTGAARAFAEHGLRRSTMQSVAAAAGVAKATLYNHFRTKDDVATALLAVDADRWAALTGRLAAALRLDADGAEIAARWLLGVVLQPGRSTARHRHAARLAAVLTATGAAAPA